METKRLGDFDYWRMRAVIAEQNFASSELKNCDMVIREATTRKSELQSAIAALGKSRELLADEIAQNAGVDISENNYIITLNNSFGEIKVQPK